MGDPKPPRKSRRVIIPVGHYAAMGRAVAKYADFELTVDRTVWKLMGVEQAIGACVTAQSGRQDKGA